MSSNLTDQQSKDEAGFVSVGIAISGIITLICFFGIALNASLVYVTVKSNLCDGNDIAIVHRSGTIDGRFISNLVRYERKISNFQSVITICLIKVIVDKCVDYYGCSKHWEKLVRCELSDPANQPEIIGYTVNNMLITVVAEILCYAMLWLISWWHHSLTDLQGKRLLRSVSVIMSINLIFNIGVLKHLLPICLRVVQFECIYAFSHCSSRCLCLLCGGPLQQCAGSFHYQLIGLIAYSSVYRRAYQSVLWPNHHQLTPVQNLQRQPNITDNIRTHTTNR
ncbi:hypothetical protein niasHT_013861 [Heterodera trifolii]|uniref:Uncharacterized protein n=1 Tax=Heterodera trifolii TaxID=157864 RepID=A0ABD2LFZ0_9BILA